MSIEELNQARNIDQINASITDPETLTAYHSAITNYFLEKINPIVYHNQKGFNTLLDKTFGKNSFESSFLSRSIKSGDSSNYSSYIESMLNKISKDKTMSNELNYFYLDKIKNIDKKTIIHESVNSDNLIGKLSEIKTREELQKYLLTPKNRSDFLNLLNNFALSKIENYPLNSEKDVKKLLTDINKNKLNFPMNQGFIKIALRQACNESLKNNGNDFKDILHKKISNSFALYQHPAEELYFSNIRLINLKNSIENKNISLNDNDEDDFTKKSNKKFLETIEDGSNPILNPSVSPALAKDFLTGEPYKGINQLNSLSNMAANEAPAVYHGGINSIIKDKPNWIENINNDIQAHFKEGKELIEIRQKGRDNKTGKIIYEMTVPLSRLNQAVVPDVPAPCDTNNVAINQTLPNNSFKPIVLNTKQDVEKFLTANYANYINSNQTDVPHTPTQYEGNLAEKTAEMLNEDPKALYKISHNAEKLALSEKISGKTINESKELRELLNNSPELKDKIYHDIFNLYNELSKNKIGSPLTTLINKQVGYFNHPFNETTFNDHINHLLGDSNNVKFLDCYKFAQNQLTAHNEHKNSVSQKI